MTKIADKEKQRIRKVAHLLYDAARRVRILRSIDWLASALLAVNLPIGGSTHEI